VRPKRACLSGRSNFALTTHADAEMTSREAAQDFSPG
jgi:hypothetical protein